jgi:dienelactone hydrolase
MPSKHLVQFVSVLFCPLAIVAARLGDLTADEQQASFVRIAGGVTGHIHPAACVTKKGTVLVIFGQSDMKDLRLSRSTDGGKTWTEPVPFAHTEKLAIYPGSLTTLGDGRVIHVWNVWYPDADAKGGKSRFPQYSISSDDGLTWSDPRDLPKNPDAESVIRHPIVELSPRDWLYSLMDKTVVYDPETHAVSPLGDGRNHGLVPIVRTPTGTLVSGSGVRSTDGGKSWQKVDPFPAIGENGWRFDLMVTSDGWLVASEVLGSGVGGERWRFVVSRDDGRTWDFDGAIEFYNPGRPIGGRACPKTVQLDHDTLGTVFYDVDAGQSGGPGVFFLRTPLARLASRGQSRGQFPQKRYEPPAEFAGELGDYRSPLKFADGSAVKSAADWPRRRKEILDKWHRRLGAWPPLVERPEVKRLETVDRDGFTQHHVRVQITPDGKQADGYLLVPDGKGPFPAVFVPFYEPQTSIGEGANGRGRGTHDYGLQLVRRGFVTLSIGTPPGSDEDTGPDTRQHLIAAGVAQKRQPLTYLAYVAANCHTALAQLPEVDPTRIGIIGLSYGGKWSMFASCLHDEFACAVWSDPGIVFNERNANVNYWEPWYLGYEPGRQRKPGIPSAENPRTGLYKQLIESGDDLVDIHALMAPRPVLVSGGTEDPPQHWRALNHLVAVNELLGHKHRVAMTERSTHVPTPEALELELLFLEYWLKPARP